ncbi:dipeptidase 1-like isoform X2 [Cimex lectularius]|uniref:Dipeptidase n=1 Tax=Cimex lectularius TaxID=79782 RepID=A0A8I6TIF4_CIMLE|nr:dipeptidase 1-like isoform X2 [Cimex lectularius]
MTHEWREEVPPLPPPPPQWRLDMDLRHHIQHCACTCNHMGYGNYMDYQVQMEMCRAQCMSEMAGARMVNGSARFNCQSRALIPTARGSVTSSSSDEERLELRPWVVACLMVVVVAGIGLGLALFLTKGDTQEEEHLEMLDTVRRILTEVPLIDGHNDLPWNIRKFVHNQLGKFNFSEDLRDVEPWSRSNWSHTDLPRLKAGQVGAQFWSAYVPCGAQQKDAVQIAMEQIDVIKRLTQIYSQDLQFVTTVAGIKEAHKNGRIASLIGVEGGHSLGSSLGVLRMFYGLGARYLTLTHTCNTPWAGCCVGNDSSDAENQGLTHFGRLVVRELNRLGMLVDLSHTSFRTMEQAINVSTAPVIFSHSSAFAICNSTRNVPDYILKQVALNGGIVMVNFYTNFISCNHTATMDDVIAHINHIRKIAGEDSVGLGAGYDGINKTPEGLEDVSRYPELLAALLATGEWNEEQLKKLAGLNILRVMTKAEQVKDNWEGEGVTVVEELLAASAPKPPSDCVYTDS